jgi:hypothetical protein
VAILGTINLTVVGILGARCPRALRHLFGAKVF